MVLKMAKFLHSELNKTIRILYESLLWKAFLYPTYDELICDETHLVIDDEELSRIVDGKFDVKGFYEWGREIHPIVVAAEFGEPYNMEWGDYQNRGPHSHSTRFLSSVMDFLPP